MPEQPPATDAKLRGRTAVATNAIREQLAKQPKIKVNVPRPLHVKKGVFHKEVVYLNGYPLTVPTGQWVELPEEVYLILVRAGKVQPVREEDQHEVPAMLTMEGPEYAQLSAGRAGSIGNPVSVL